MIEHYFNLMTDLLDEVEPEDYDRVWDEFWTLSSLVSNIKYIEWYDPDTTYYEDITNRYLAIKEYLATN